MSEMFTVPYFQTPNDIFKTNLKTNEKMVYIYLCRCGNEGKDAFPSYQTIAKSCSTSKSSAIRSMNRLIEVGLVIKQYRFKEGENYSNIYKVNYNLGGVIETLPSITETTPSFTLTPNKELDKKNYLEKTNTLHLLSEEAVSFFNLLESFSLYKFEKPIRKHYGDYDLEFMDGMDIEGMKEFIKENVVKYEQCNLDYVQTIQRRCM